MIKNPLEILLVNESDVPKLKAEVERARKQPRPIPQYKADAAAREERRKMSAEEAAICRRLRVRGAVIDVLGKGPSARVWVGRRGDDTANDYLFSLDREDMSALVRLWNEAK